jgi:hypothetical protein
VNNTPQLGWIKSSKLDCEPGTDDSQLCTLKREQIAVPVYSRPNGKVLSCFKGDAGYERRNDLSVLDTPCQEAIYCENPSASCEVFKLLARVTNKDGLKYEDEEKKYFTPDLNNFLSKLTDEQWRDYDGDPVTSSQDPAALKVEEVSAQNTGDRVSVVKVILGCDGCSPAARTMRIDYKTKLIQQHWRIDDIIYFDGDKSETLRQIFKRLGK